MELAATFTNEETAVEERPLYNSRIISTFLKFIKRHYSYVNVSELLIYAMMEPYQVEDETHWFTQEQVDRFYERLVKLTNNRNIAREAGRYAAAPDTSGLVRQYVLGFVGPARVYEMIGKATANFVRSSVYEAKKVGPNRVEINVVPLEGVQEKPYQCENRTGYFEAVATVFNYKLPKIEHTECMFKGGKTCRYLISWQELRSAFWKRVGYLTTFGMALTCFLAYFFLPHVPMIWLLLPSFLLVLSLTVYASDMERTELSAATDNLRISTESLMDQINTNYNNALLINEIGMALSKQTDVEGILHHVVQVLEKRLDYDRGMILLANKERSLLKFEAGFGYVDEQRKAMRQTSFHLDKPDAKGIFVVSFRDQKPFLINDIDEIMDDLSPRSLEFARRMGSKSFICCPIMHVDESMGILAVDNLRTKRPLLQSDINLLMGIAPEIAISIHNANLIEEREQQFQSILRALASTIDARDPLTAGHSENVTEYAVAICNELGLSREYREMIRVASLLHDYGKIGISDDILKKKGLLTKEEREEIKTHSVKSMRILDQINFTGIYRQVPDIVGCHHEKYDGTGYPRGLRGEQIPLGARIIAVADVFEAITAKRHYREPMPIEDAIRILLTERGRHFDARIVDAFLTFFMREKAAGTLKS